MSTCPPRSFSISCQAAFLPREGGGGEKVSIVALIGFAPLSGVPFVALSGLAG